MGSSTNALNFRLQGGPGASSLFGMLELHGPYQSVFDENGNTVVVANPHAWTRKANVIYIDNPVGGGLNLFFLKVPRPGGEPGIFWFESIYGQIIEVKDLQAWRLMAVLIPDEKCLVLNN